MVIKDLLTYLLIFAYCRPIPIVVDERPVIPTYVHRWKTDLLGYNAVADNSTVCVEWTSDHFGLG